MAATAEALRTIGRDELKQTIDQGEPFILLETLPAEDFESGHLLSARSIPLDRIRDVATRLIPSKDCEVVTCCANSGFSTLT
jgi:hypothetical protein